VVPVERFGSFLEGPLKMLEAGWIDHTHILNFHLSTLAQGGEHALKGVM
jgi:hypothetical protein